MCTRASRLELEKLKQKTGTSFKIRELEKSLTKPEMISYFLDIKPPGTPRWLEIQWTAKHCCQLNVK